MKSNRQARRLFKPGITSMYRISNRQWLLCASNYQFVWHTKPSRQQRKTRRIGDDALRRAIVEIARALAEEHAEECIQYYRDKAEEGWDELVDRVCWGEIKAETVQVGLRPATEDDSTSCEMYCDYALNDVTDEPVQEQKA